MDKAINKFEFFKRVKNNKMTKKDYFKMALIWSGFILFADFTAGLIPNAIQLDTIAKEQKYSQAKEAMHYKNFYSNETYELKDLKTLIIEQNSNISSLKLSQAVMSIKTDSLVPEAVKKESIELYNKNYLLGVNRQKHDFSQLHCSVIEPMCNMFVHYIKSEVNTLNNKTIEQLEANKKIINSESLNFDEKKTTHLVEENKF